MHRNVNMPPQFGIWPGYNSLLLLISPLGKLWFIHGNGMNYIWPNNNHFMNYSSTNMMLLPHGCINCLLIHKKKKNITEPNQIKPNKLVQRTKRKTGSPQEAKHKSHTNFL